MSKNEFPMQPKYRDAGGVVRFMPNRIVRDLLDKATAAKIMDLNTIAIDAQCHGRYTREERRQFAQLIGYSVNGYGDLTQYVSDRDWECANDAPVTNRKIKPTPPPSPAPALGDADRGSDAGG